MQSDGLHIYNSMLKVQLFFKMHIDVLCNNNSKKNYKSVIIFKQGHNTFILLCVINCLSLSL